MPLQKKFQKVDDFCRDKPHQCKTCRRSFAQLKNLRAHQQVHAAHKPFTCQVCKRTFGRNTTLRAHQRTHTGEKPFNCQRCGDSFRHKISLKHHERTHEDDDGLKIETKEDLISDAVSCPTEVGPFVAKAVGFADEKCADSSREEEQARWTIFEFGGLFADIFGLPCTPIYFAVSSNKQKKNP